MSTKYFKTLLLALPLVALAFVASAAYTPPPAFPEDTPVVPVTVGDARQTKTGALSVEVFTAYDRAELQSMVFIGNDESKTSMIRGCQITQIDRDCTDNPESLVTFNQSGGTSLFVQKDVETTVAGANKGIGSDQLDGSGTRRVCLDGSSKIVVCP